MPHTQHLQNESEMDLTVGHVGINITQKGDVKWYEISTVWIMVAADPAGLRRKNQECEFHPGLGEVGFF